jgi:hypothetical protein
VASAIQLSDFLAGVLAALAAGLGQAAAGPAADSPEWTFEQARQCWQPMVRAVQHVGVPGYQFQTAVMWDGALVFGPLDFRQLEVMQAELAPLGETRLHVSVGFDQPLRLVDRQGTANPAIRRHLEEGRLPIPHVVTRAGDLEWDELVFAHLLGREIEDGLAARPDDRLVTHALFTVRNLGQARRPAYLWLHFGDTSQVRLGYKCAQLDGLAPAIPHHYEAPLGWVGDKIRYVLPAPERGECHAQEEASVQSGASGVARKVIAWKVELAPGEQAALRLVIPYGLMETNRARQLLGLDARAAFPCPTATRSTSSPHGANWPCCRGRSPCACVPVMAGPCARQP